MSILPFSDFDNTTLIDDGILCKNLPETILTDKQQKKGEKIKKRK